MTARPLLLMLALLAAPAVAQDPVLVCVRAEDGTCIWVSQDELPQASPVPAPPSPPQDERALNGAGLETEVWFDWQADRSEVDPSLGKPGTCARTAGRARYRFEMAMQSGNLNKVIESYDWRGKKTADAERITERLGMLPRNGVWERSVVSGWAGTDGEASSLASTHWRWNAGQHVAYFRMRKVDDCWFIAFGDQPATSAIVRRQRQAERPANEEEPGVYEF